MRVARRVFTGEGRHQGGDACEDYEAVELAHLPMRGAANPVVDGELRRVRDTIWLILTSFGYRPSQINAVCKQLSRSERQIQRRIEKALDAVGGDEGEMLDNLIATLRRYRERRNVG